MLAAFAGSVQDRESTAHYERHNDNDRYYGSIHCSLALAVLEHRLATRPKYLSVWSAERCAEHGAAKATGPGRASKRMRWLFKRALKGEVPLGRLGGSVAFESPCISFAGFLFKSCADQ